MKIKLTPIQVQRHILAPQMQQSITVLMLPIAQLSAAVEQELQANPLLETVDSTQDVQQNPEDAPRIDNLKEIIELPSDSFYSSINDGAEDPATNVEAKQSTLEEYLLQQILFELTDPHERRIAEFIVGSLDADGYLSLSSEEIAKALPICTLEEVDYILEKIHFLDPPGIATRTLSECLSVQLMQQGALESDIVVHIASRFLDELGKRKYRDIAHTLQTSTDAVLEAAALIATLEPRPARNFRPVDNGIYIKPDLTIREVADEYSVVVNSEEIPQLRINASYRELLKRKDLKPEERTFIEEKLESAINFIRSVRQRGDTMTAIGNHIIEHQKGFLKNGYRNLVPMRLKDVALAIERDESTISRATRSKYIDTPQGFFAMKFFFSGGISTEASGPVASQSIKEEIRELIKEENQSSPLSDQDIQEHFKEKGVNLARRTIAKYRQMLKIDPSYLRKR